VFGAAFRSGFEACAKSSKLRAIEPAQMAAKHLFFGDCALFAGFYQKERG
jgi:hypothetical protein